MENPNAPLTQAHLQEALSKWASHFDGRLTGIDSRLTGIDSRFAAMDARLVAMDARLTESDARNNERHDMLRAEMHHMHDDLVERIDAKETKGLQAFYSYTESNQKRLAGVETEEASLKSRLSSLEDRVIELEKR